MGITGLSHLLERFYHTRLDTPENLNPTALENCLKATEEFIREADMSLCLCGGEEDEEESIPEEPEDEMNNEE